jgi:hypothetical protein
MCICMYIHVHTWIFTFHVGIMLYSWLTELLHICKSSPTILFPTDHYLIRLRGCDPEGLFFKIDLHNIKLITSHSVLIHNVGKPTPLPSSTTFFHQKISYLLMSNSSSSLPHSPWPPPTCCMSLWIYSCWMFHTNEILPHVNFAQLLSVSLLFLRSS